MSEIRYPYKIRVQFTDRQRDGLAAAAAHHDTGITEMIRRYVTDGLKADGFDNPPTPVADDQLKFTD